MKKLNAYKVYLDDGEMTYSVMVPAENKARAKEYVKGNGEVIAVKESEITIDVGTIVLELQRLGYDKDGIALLARTLRAVANFAR